MENYDWQRGLLWAGFVFFLGSLLLRADAAINQDLGRHLRLGEMIVGGGEGRRCALFTNCLTYTYPDYPFINHHWGAEVIFYFIYKLGGFGRLILFKTVILGMAFLITVRHASAVRNTQNTQKAGISENQRARASGLLTSRFSDTSGSPSFPSVLKISIAMILVFLSINMMADRLTTRPEIFGYLLFSLLFWILNKSCIDDKRSLLIYITPAIILLWVNLHISFVFGLILVWVWAVVKIFGYRFSIVGYQSGVNRSSVSRFETDKLETENRKPKTDNWLTLIIVFTSTLVTVLNPSGPRGALMPLSIMKDYGYTIVENMTPFFLRAFKPQPEYWIYAILLLLATLLLITSPKRPSLFSILTFYAFAVFPLIAVRHLAFFALTAPVILAKGLTFSFMKFRKLHNDSEKFAKLLTVGLILAAMTNPVPLAYAKLPATGLMADNRHNQAVEFVRKNNLPGRMWNNYDIGSYLEWALPEHKTFVDGRPEAFPPGFFQQTYIPMQQSRQKWDEIVKEYDIQWVFAALTDATPWFQKWWTMIRKHEDWKLIYIDKSTAILIRQ